MDPFTIFWTLFLLQYRFAISNCGVTENPKNKLETKSESPRVDKSGESSELKKSNTTKPRSFKDVLNDAKNSGTPETPILARPPLNEKNQTNTNAQAKPSVPSNAAAVDGERKSKTKLDEQKTKVTDLQPRKKMDKLEETKKILNEKRDDSSTQSTSSSMGNRLSSVKLNPNAATFIPKTKLQITSPNVAATPPKNSADSKELSLNPNAATFHPKIYPILREMFILSERMMRIEPDFPRFEKKIIFPEALIVTYDCLYGCKKDSDLSEDNSIITSISIFNIKRERLVYKAYPKIKKIKNLAAYHNADTLNEVDPETRKDEATIGKEITQIIKGKVIVGINLGKIIALYKIKVKPFDMREITSLAKYADVLNATPGRMRKNSLWYRKHKELLGTFLPELREEFKSLTILKSEDKRKYIFKLFAKLRPDWESEVLFLKRLYGYYGRKPKDIMAQFGSDYPGLHGHRPHIDRKVPAFPEELIGLHIRYDKWNKFIASVTAIDHKLGRMFKAFVRNVETIEVDSDGAVIGRLEAIVNYIFENNYLTRNSMIVGFDVYKLMQILDSGKKLKGARIYDTKTIFEARTVTELAATYLKIDFRSTFLKENFDPRKSAEEEPKSFESCDMKMPIEFAAKISMQMFRLYTLDQHSKVQALKLWE